MPPFRILLALLLVAGAGVGGYVLSERALVAVSADAGAARPGNATLRVQTAPIAEQVFVDRLMAVGTTRAGQAVDIRAATAGQIAQILFTPGQPVAAGAPLLRLDDTHAAAAHKAAQATLSEARAALARQQSLSQTGSGTQAALEAARASFMRAEADVEMAAAVLDDHVVTAPFDGVAGLTDLAIGQYIDANSTITTLDDTTRMEVAFGVPERVMARLAIGQQVEIASSAYPDANFTGTITAIDTRVDQATRSIALRAEVPNADGALVGGMFVQVFLVLDERRAPAVPEQALFVADGQTHVYLAEDGKARRLAVETGALQQGEMEIRAPATLAGEVILTNLQRLSDGSEIEIVPQRQAMQTPDAGAAP